MLVKENFEVIGYPFVGHVDQNAKPTISVEYVLNYYKNKGYKGNMQDLLSNGTIRRMGYLYDFKPFLKEYIYEQYGSWTKAYAPNKTLLRQNIYGRITRIVEVK